MLLLTIRAGVVPGMVITELWDKMGQSKDQQKDLFDKSAKRLPVGFVATPEDVSLCSCCSKPFRADSLIDRGSVFVLCKLQNAACL